MRPHVPEPIPRHARFERLLLTTLAALALAIAWFSLADISDRDPWYRNANMNIHDAADALSLNSGYAPGVVDQPGAVPKFLLALDYRVRNEFELLPIWTLKRFARSQELLPGFAQLVQVGREHSRLLVFLFILISAAFVGQVTGRYDAACFAVVLLCGSSGLLFHGLLSRPELLCVGFGGVLAPHCAWRANATTRAGMRALWLLLAGGCVGLSLLSKLPAWLYLGLLGAWCCVLPALPPNPNAALPANQVHRGWTLTLCLGAGLAVLGLLHSLELGQNPLNPVTTARLRALAALVALSPLLAFLGARGTLARYLVERLLEMALLIAGVIATCTAWLALLRTVLPAEAAASYHAKILDTVFHPDPLVRLFTSPGAAHLPREFLRFTLETPALFLTTTLLAGGLAFFRAVPLRQRVLVLSLLAQAVGMTALMSRREFLDQYSIFAQVPLLLAWAVALATLHDWWRGVAPPTEQRWPVALAATGALVLVLIAPVDLRLKYRDYQDDAALPVNELTVTYLYDHDAHPPAYLTALKARYPTRQAFTAELNHYLSEPSHRYPAAP